MAILHSSCFFFNRSKPERELEGFWKRDEHRLYWGQCKTSGIGRLHYEWMLSVICVGCRGCLTLPGFSWKIIVKPRRSSGGRLHRIWSLWFSPSRCNWEDRQSCLQGSLFLSFCFPLLMSAIQNIVLEYIFIWTVGRNYFKLVTMKSSQRVFNFLFLLRRSS